MPKLVFDGIAEVRGSNIHGRALIPGISRNGNLYTPDQIETSKNQMVPLKLDWEHTEEKIGTIEFHYDKEQQVLNYTGVIQNTDRLKEIKEGKHQVSIEARPERIEHVCTPIQCYNMVIGLTWEGLGITTNPGIISSTLFLEEMYQDWDKITESCKECKIDKELERKYSNAIKKGIDEQDCNQLDVDLNRCIPDVEKRLAKLESFFCLDCGNLKKKNR